MSTHTSSLTWPAPGATPAAFTYATYSRDHVVTWGTGRTTEVSAAPEYKGNPTLPNPEELLVGALSSCHMLTFLAVAARKGLVVERYTDNAVGTLAKDETCWCRWTRFCTIVGTTPWRMDRAAHSGADPIGFERESKLLCAFLIWSYGDIKPRSLSDPAPKPASAYAMVCGIRRIHKRFNIDMVACSQLSAVLKGITQAFIEEHGAEALLPLRKEPIGPELLRRILSVARTAKGPVDWSSPTLLCLGGMFALGGGTGFRKSD